MPVLLGILIVAVLIIGILLVLLLKRKPKSPPVTDTVNIYRSILGQPAGASPSPPAATPATDDPNLAARLRQDLRLKFLYQEDKIDHAIQLERDRNPTAPLTTLMQSAIERYERDNR